MRLAEGLVRRGFHELAQNELNAWLAKNPAGETAARARLLLLECQRVKGEDAAALAEIEQFAKNWPTHPRLPTVQLVRGELLARQGDLAGAIAALTPSTASFTA